MENAWPALVDRETFDKVQRLMRDRAPSQMHPRRTSSSYLLSGIAKCRSCGKSLSGQVAKSGQFAYYVCGTLLRSGKGSCSAPYLNAARFEATVLARLREQVITEENLRNLVALVNEELVGASAQFRERLDVIEAELGEVRRRLERLYDALETGKLDLDDLAPRIQHFRHRQDQLQAAKHDLDGQMADEQQRNVSLDEVLPYVEDLKGLLDESSLTERKGFIRSFVKEIEVGQSDAVIRYSLPIPAEVLPHAGNVVGDTLGVLSSVRYGGRYWARTSDLCDVNAVL